jgi:protein-S-isoprenylcysteine O-methyltransferase Ste14
MKRAIELLSKIFPLLFIWLIWLWALSQPLSQTMNLCSIVGGVLIAFPIVWLGRMFLDKQPTTSRAVRITAIIHYSLGILFGVPIIRAISTHQEWSGWMLPIPVEIGLFLVLITGAAVLLTVLNLALKGLGAPFVVVLSKKLAVEWLYAWTRNPMVLALLALLVSLGIWFQSALFVLWVLIIFSPALLFFVRTYEERELEIRFGASYLEYKSRTPILLPRRPRR